MQFKNLIEVVKYDTHIIVSEEYGTKKKYFDGVWKFNHRDNEFDRKVLNGDVSTVSAECGKLLIEVITED